jgi:hypothetical protein
LRWLLGIFIVLVKKAHNIDFRGIAALCCPVANSGQQLPLTLKNQSEAKARVSNQAPFGLSHIASTQMNARRLTGICFWLVSTRKLKA